MSGGEVRKVSLQEVQLVQNLIEYCLQLHMNQKEVIDILLYKAKIEPVFTKLVWQKLEEENQGFFKAYHARLMLKVQIMIFNELLKNQLELMSKFCFSRICPVPPSNGSSSSILNQDLPCYLLEKASASWLDSSFYNDGVSSSIAMINSDLVQDWHMQLDNVASSTCKTDVFAAMLTSQSSHMERVQGMSGATINPELGYLNNCVSDTKSEIEGTIGDSFDLPELTFQTLNDYQCIDSSPYGFSNILESYVLSPYLSPDSNNFMGFTERQYKERQMDTISEDLFHEDIGVANSIEPLDGWFDCF